MIEKNPVSAVFFRNSNDLLSSVVVPCMSTTRESYPGGATDAEWELLVPGLALMRKDTPQRDHSLQESLTGCGKS